METKFSELCKKIDQMFLEIKQKIDRQSVEIKNEIKKNSEKKSELIDKIDKVYNDVTELRKEITVLFNKSFPL